MTNSIQSTTNGPKARLSTSYIIFHDRIVAKGFHFKKQLFNDRWTSVPRCSAEHKQRLASLEATISNLLARGK